MQSLLFYASISISVLSLLLLILLAKARAKAKRAHHALALRNQEIESQHHEIRAQKQVLEELNEVKDRMFSIIAHDFRSPLNTIQGVLNLLHHDALSQDELKMLLPDLTRKVDASINLLDNLLHWARAQMQGVRINPHCFSIKKVITESVVHLHQLATQKDILIQTFIDDTLYVYADLEMIRLVVRNLLSNAIKFSHQGHAVHIEVTQCEESAGQFAVIAITDFGVGIPENVLPDLLNRNGYTTKGTAQEKGTGLGLTLCQECVKKNGGEIKVMSQIGQKTTFSFTIPLVDVPQAAEVYQGSR